MTCSRAEFIQTVRNSLKTSRKGNVTASMRKAAERATHRLSMTEAVANAALWNAKHPDETSKPLNRKQRLERASLARAYASEMRRRVARWMIAWAKAAARMAAS